MTKPQADGTQKPLSHQANSATEADVANPTNPNRQYHFRIRENGALVFRINPANRQRRIEMQQIAVANTKRGDFKAVQDHALTDDDRTAIQNWLTDRQEHLQERKYRDAEDLIDRLSMTAQWVQSEAVATQLDALSDRLIFAMHDLRTVLVRKMGQRNSQGGASKD
ncbi:hypothetical protein SLH49_11330 [Cognatiyoonia sp. IB215446]|uniref:hypothetical protein n=1 Tax=Cognatiyoonia sp. IB215446 TaxID=3097355 RepID=UPI002A0F6B3E|nr:hypothetical protein [Cognatiyoonia sp. IB215446]MDX8348578.1 hypothetical protein [Cognatiyoonia sp. IB215446]